MEDSAIEQQAAPALESHRAKARAAAKELGVVASFGSESALLGSMHLRVKQWSDSRISGTRRVKRFRVTSADLQRIVAAQ